MKIVHEIDAPATVMAFSQGPYARRPDDTSPIYDFPVAVEIHAPIPITKQVEVVIIEGSARHIRDALVAAIKQIDALGYLQIRDGKLDPDWTEGPIHEKAWRMTERENFNQR